MTSSAEARDALRTAESAHEARKGELELQLRDVKTTLKVALVDQAVLRRERDDTATTLEEEKAKWAAAKTQLDEELHFAEMSTRIALSDQQKYMHERDTARDNLRKAQRAR